MSRTKLKPCPFCGGEAYMDNFLTRGDDGEWIEVYSVCCDNEVCLYKPYTERFTLSVEAAAEMWNKRANE